MEFTPTTDQVRETWAEVQDMTFGDGLDSHGEEFDRWLNEERAKAFDRGASALGDSFWDGDAGVVVNPYRRADR